MRQCFYCGVIFKVWFCGWFKKNQSVLKPCTSGCVQVCSLHFLPHTLLFISIMRSCSVSGAFSMAFKVVLRGIWIYEGQTMRGSHELWPASKNIAWCKEVIAELRAMISLLYVVSIGLVWGSSSLYFSRPCIIFPLHFSSRKKLRICFQYAASILCVQIFGKARLRSCVSTF